MSRHPTFKCFRTLLHQKAHLVLHKWLTPGWPAETLPFGHKPAQCCPEPWTWLLGVYWQSDRSGAIRNHCLVVRMTDDASVDSQSSHHCSASSRSLWWCSNALSIFPNSIQAFPMHPCRFPKTSFLFGNSFSDHPCTVFNTSSAFFRPPFAFPDVNSTLKNIQLGILNNKSAISSSPGSVYLHQCLLDSLAETLQVLLAFGERMKYL